MNESRLHELLERVRDGRATVAQGAAELAHLPILELGHSRLDTHRALRCGFPEVVFGAGKWPEELVELVGALCATHDRCLVTRATPEGAAAVLEAHPALRYWERSRALTLGLDGPLDAPGGAGHVVVASAGTADGGVAEEAAITARLLGARVDWLRDVGVAGIHRLLAHAETLRSARALVVVAGMEGALPSVVGGLVERPVIAVPTSVGYGASFGGLAALLAMLNSCAAGVTVVNVDNGFGAGYAAALINRVEPAPAPSS